jgi:predicted nucleic acid-binding protein
MIAVIDTSALIRLFIPDGPIPQGLEKFFMGVESGVNTAVAPELMLAEAASVLLKKARTGELSEEEGQQMLKDIHGMPVRLFGHKDIIFDAYEIGRQHNLTVYDALFLALAVRHSAQLFSADEKMMQAVNALGLPTGSQ